MKAGQSGEPRADSTRPGRRGRGLVRRRACGFTLVEVMLVLLIVGVLAAIAYPAFASHVVKARRTEAQVALLELMQMQERHYSEHNTYLAFAADGMDGAGPRFKWYSGSAAHSSAYELSGKACPNLPLTTCIELKAVPGTARVDSAFRDAGCGTLSFDSHGAHGASGADGARCWP